MIFCFLNSLGSHDQLGIEICTDLPPGLVLDIRAVEYVLVVIVLKRNGGLDNWPGELNAPWAHGLGLCFVPRNVV